MKSRFNTLRLRKCSPGCYGRGVKRVLDFLIALTALLLLLPLLVLIALLLCIAQGGCPFFVQKRIGRHCKPFNIIKFKTMNDKRAEDGSLLPDELRTTWIGAILRSTSLDELPELLNVIAGDMSFIGPRPWVPEQMVTFKPATQQHRMLVRPGISGLAQILGRNDLTFRQRVCYDIGYIRNLSFRLDARIFFYTIYKVVMREGIEQRPGALEKSSPRLAPKDPDTKGLRGNRPTGKLHVPS